MLQAPVNCNLGHAKNSNEFCRCRCRAEAAINGSADDTTGCVPLMVHFTDTLFKRQKDIYGILVMALQGYIAVGPDTSHTYLTAGTLSCYSCSNR